MKGIKKMKIVKLMFTLLAVTLMTALTPDAFSQTGLGFEGGINIGDISIAGIQQTTSGRTGLTVGAFADIGITRNFYIRPGLRYVMKGFSWSNGAGTNFTDKLSYLEIPAMLKVSFPLTEVKPYIMAGPTLGIMLTASQDQVNAQQTQNFDASSIYETIDFGLYFGTGIDFHVANRMDMFFGGGYSLGLTNIHKSQNNVQTFTKKNYGIQVTAGMKFGL